MRSLLLAAVLFLFIQQGHAKQPDSTFAKPFRDGSPACTSCHSIAAAGYTAAAWGPDISGLGDMLGDDPQAWADFAKTSGIPAMDAAYAESRLTAEDFIALAAAYEALPPAEGEPKLTGREIAGYAVLFMLIMAGLAKIIFRRNPELENE